jgi:cytochrome c biogenesis protein CcdA
MNWQGVLIIIGLVVALAGLITLVRPMPRFWISNRWRAGLVLAAGLVIAGSGFASGRCGCALPPINPPISSTGKQ